jgi:hypothetical protein
MSELQAALAGAIGHGLHAAVVLVSGAVEDDLRDAGRLRLLRDALADRDDFSDFVPVSFA